MPETDAEAEAGEVSDVLDYLQDLDERLTEQLERIAGGISRLQVVSEQPGSSMRTRTAKRGGTIDAVKVSALEALRQQLQQQPGERHMTTLSTRGFATSGTHPLQMPHTGNARCVTDSVLPKYGDATGPFRRPSACSDTSSVVVAGRRCSTSSLPKAEPSSPSLVSWRSPSVGPVQPSVRPRLRRQGSTESRQTVRISEPCDSEDEPSEVGLAEEVESSLDLGKTAGSPRSPLSSVSSPWRLFTGTEGSQEFTQALNMDFELNVATGRWVLLPGSRLRTAWDTLIVLATLMVITLTPLDLVYWSSGADGSLSYGTRTALLCAADTLWILDIAVNFRTAFLSQGRAVRNLWPIAAAYGRSWLVPDALTAWPVVLAPPGAVLALRVFKMARLVRLVNLLDRLQKDLRFFLLLPLKILLVGCLCIHLIANLWRRALQADIKAAQEHSQYVAIPSLDWLPEETWWDHYLMDVYWVMVTMTTLGYGDIIPHGRMSRLVAMFTIFIAPLLNGAVICLLTHMTANFFNDDVHRQIVAAAHFMSSRAVPPELQRRVEHNLRSQLRQDRQLILVPNLLAKLSANMQRELTLQLLSKTVVCFPLFKNAPIAFIAEIAQAHSWVECGGGDLVAEEGQLEEDLVFVVVGRLFSFCTSVLRKRDPVKDAKECFEAGAWFGEACLFFSDSVRGTSIFARTDAELVVLQATDFHAVIKKYPQLCLRHAGIKKELHAGSLCLSSLAYQPPPPGTRMGFWRLWSNVVRPRKARAARVADVAKCHPILV